MANNDKYNAINGEYDEMAENGLIMNRRKMMVKMNTMKRV